MKRIFFASIRVLLTLKQNPIKSVRRATVLCSIFPEFFFSFANSLRYFIYKNKNRNIEEKLHINNEFQQPSSFDLGIHLNYKH